MQGIQIITLIFWVVAIFVWLFVPKVNNTHIGLSLFVVGFIIQLTTTRGYVYF